MSAPEVILGWHFVGETLRDGRPVPADGEWLVHDGPVVPCESGLHASEHPFDALRYAPGPILCRVELAGDLVSHGDPRDKWVGRRRRIVARRDATQMLRRFASDEALRVAHLWAMPDVVREYLTTLDESLRAAAEAAVYAASDAAYAATYAATYAERAAERAAAAAAAAAAERAASAAAAAAASAYAARDAAWARQRVEFEQRVQQLFGMEAAL